MHTSPLKTPENEEHLTPAEAIARTQTALQKAQIDLSTLKNGKYPTMDDPPEDKDGLLLKAYTVLFDDVKLRDFFELELKPICSPGHQAMFERLLSHARKLYTDAFLGSTGSACRVISANKGIGKSTTMRVFTYFLPAIYSPVIPIFLDFTGCEDESHFLRRGTLMHEVHRRLEEHGVPKPKDTSAQALEVALMGKGKRLLLMCDEFEKLYTLKENHPSNLNAVGTLGQLDMLVNLGSNTYSVFLCGSAAALPRLVTAKFKEIDREEYPMHLLDLNDTKFSKVLLPSPPTTSPEVVNGAFTEDVAKEKVDKTKIHRALFYTGGNLRMLSKFILDGKGFTNLLEPPFTRKEDFPMLVYHAFYKKNKAVIAPYLKNLDAAFTKDYPIRFHPLTATEISDIADQVYYDKKPIPFLDPNSSNAKPPQIGIDSLRDKGLIWRAADGTYYPQSLNALTFYTRELKMSSIREPWLRFKKYRLGIFLAGVGLVGTTLATAAVASLFQKKQHQPSPSSSS